MSTQQITSFSQLPLSTPILKAIEEVGYETPSPIQAESIPPLLEGRDLLGQAQTGTGKTAAFSLPLLSRLNLDLAEPQILVLTPTRELAIQVAEAMQSYSHYLPGFHILPIYGGQSMQTQLRALKRGVHVVVGTPGRIQDHLRRGSLNFNGLKAVVLDEADEMLRMGFVEEVEAILEYAPAERQTALFSATMPSAVRRVAQQHLIDPVEIQIKAKTTTVEGISQHYWQVTGLHKLDALTRILEVEKFDAAIIFVRTKTATVELADKLEARGYAAAALNGDMNQALREKTIERLKNNSLDIVIATDVAARGLDVARISLVVNYDIPTDPEAYVHRIGRTGRAGREGKAILFVAPRESRMLRSIERSTRQQITPMRMPSHEEISDHRIGQFKQHLEETLEKEELDFFAELISQYQHDSEHDLTQIAAALTFLAQRERPLQVPKKKDRAEQSLERFDDERSERGDRGGDRGDRPRRERPPRRQREEAEEGMIRYRVEVGRAHGVQPKHLVGAIANEAGIDSQHIGRIQLFDQFSTVDLPDGMPKEVFQHLRKVWVCRQQLQISVDNPPGEQRGSGSAYDRGERGGERGAERGERGEQRDYERPKPRFNKPSGKPRGEQRSGERSGGGNGGNKPPRRRSNS